MTFCLIYPEIVFSCSVTDPLIKDMFPVVMYVFFMCCLQWLREGLSKHFCSMEKEDLKILNKGGEEEMVWRSLIRLQYQIPPLLLAIIIVHKFSKSY